MTFVRVGLLRHPLLMSLAEKVDRGASPLRWIDLYAAQYIADCLNEQQSDPHEDEVVRLSLLLSYASGQGATYLSLTDLPEDLALGFRLPKLSLSDWQSRLECSSAVRVADPISDGTEGRHESSQTLDCPLVLCHERLYLARYWRLQRTLERWLEAQSVRKTVIPADLFEPLAGILRQVFDLPSEQAQPPEPDWQAVAAAHPLVQNFTLITGGPGTGKTTTAASLLYLLIRRHALIATMAVQSTNDAAPKLPVIRLLAPTGKAAVKLADAIAQQLSAISQRLLDPPEDLQRLQACLPVSGATIHRFLYQQGALREPLNLSTRLRSDEILLGRASARLAEVDIVIIDEASMIDLALMVQLLAILPPTAQIIMLGDHHQLPAVEPGQVFAELVARFSGRRVSGLVAQQLAQLTGFSVAQLQVTDGSNVIETHPQVVNPVLGDDFFPLCRLKKTYRFEGVLQHTASLINSGNSAALIDLLTTQVGTQGGTKALDWHPPGGSFDDMIQSMIGAYREYFEQVKKGADLAALATAFERFQILCTTHEGPLGVSYINQVIEQYFGYHAGLYHGKVLLITRNHPHLGVFNGDLGFVLDLNGQGNLEVYFEQANQSPLIIAPGRLRAWQPAYAMTVHKSQGSEYRHVAVVLADYARELLTRELLYTGVTRSQQRCELWASETALTLALKQHSGVRR